MFRHFTPAKFAAMFTLAVVLAIPILAARADDSSPDFKATPEKSSPEKSNSDKTSSEKSAQASPNSEKSKPKGNPYLPRTGMSVEDLQAYIERMQEAPDSIRGRPGFAEGMAVAAQRILDTDPKGSLRTFAVITLLDSLHQEADSDGNADADKELGERAAKYASDADKKIAADAAFYVLEQRVLKSDDLSPDKLPALLEEIKTALKGQQLDAKHLRIASATVRVINRLKDDATATKWLIEFGQLFAASNDPVFSRYGKKILRAVTPDAEQAQWAGKPMELSGTTAEGGKFDVAQYSGKVIVVDFWHSQHPPSTELISELKKLYKQNHEQGLEVVGVNLDEDIPALNSYLDKEKLPWVNLVGEEKDGQLQFPLAEKYKIQSLPMVFLVGKDGKIALVGDGKNLAKQIEKLLAGNSSAKPEAK
ncbi:MAG TPA: TlpA disulfide reductase family protein [Pirellulales bacterium]|nr:TlpA disulfide reductase family protein [Pirellulales bacterium]